MFRTPYRAIRLIAATAMLVTVGCGLTACRSSDSAAAADITHAAPVHSTAGTTTAPAAAPTSASTTAPTTTTPKPTTTSKPVGAATPSTGADGSVTVSITAPVTLHGTASTAVDCSTGRLYDASAGATSVGGDTIAFSVLAAGYRGPGTYAATATLVITQPSGTVTALTVPVKTTAALTGTGGSVPLSATGANGAAVNATISWTCG